MRPDVRMQSKSSAILRRRTSVREGIRIKRDHTKLNDKGQWHKAKIILIEADKYPGEQATSVPIYRIHYLGWGKRYDEWMFSDSLMLQNAENDAKASGVKDVFMEPVNETVDAITVITVFDEQKKKKNAADAEETKRKGDEDKNDEDEEGDEDDEDNEESDCVNNVSGKLSGKELEVLRWTASKKHQHGEFAVWSASLAATLRMKFEVTKGKGRGHGDDRPLKRNLTLSPTGLENFLELFERIELYQILAPRRSHTLEETTKRPEKTAVTQKAEGAKKAGVTKNKSQDKKSQSVKPAQPASAKETRESSVDRAVRYLMSL
ncbi:hypothetical protein RvY_01310 [Ramazzottius varieornatus]|uniref:Tudor-knot domain-containing protein n=1 Tax=Ramazzottius varieornatus TaxID=947166 RepID=A0A1D1UFW1_RAMVA|nr:hypothetical protein RvY_01310 [Ramazzottius varieornatus]